MENKVHFIYITTNLINNKKYIGKHYGYINDSYLGSGILLKQDIEKYGKENFNREILDYSKNDEENSEKEKFYINKYNAVESDNFYNIHVGGKGGDTFSGHSEEQKENIKKKMSERSKGKNNPRYGIKLSDDFKKHLSYVATYIRDNSVYRTSEYREKMSELKSGKNNGMYGKHHTEESKQKMSEHRKGLTVGEKNGMYGKKDENAINGKTIGMYDSNNKLIKIFPTKLLVLKYLRLKGHTGLDNAIKNGTKYHNYYWKELKKEV